MSMANELGKLADKLNDRYSCILCELQELRMFKQWVIEFIKRIEAERAQCEACKRRAEKDRK